MPDDNETAPIRRGRGLRLSTPTPPEQASQPPPQPAPEPTAPEPTAPEPPLHRGRGLRLTTHTPPEESAPPPSEPEAAEPLNRGRGLRLTTHHPAPDLAPPLRARVRVPSGLTSYIRFGEGPPLLLLHGFGASGRIWRGVMSALGDVRTCFALDLPGFGESPPRPDAPTLAALADEVVACADALQLERFDLVGHSLGSALAARVAGRYRGRMGRLALTSLGVRTFAPELAALNFARPSVDLSFNFVRPVLDLWQPWGRWAWETPPVSLLIGSQVLHTPPQERQLWQEYLADHARADGRAYLTSIAATGDPGLQTDLRAITAETLLIVGREDRIASLPLVMTAQQLIGGSRLEVIDSCGHLPIIERPDEYHALLRAFFAP